MQPDPHIGVTQSRRYNILLGGVGGDSHSIGLTILRQALLINDYNVCALGIQNTLASFFHVASLCNIVMISTMDGHARYYLSNFPELLKQYDFPQTLWYLGGNLSIDDAPGGEQFFRELGFHRVFTKFVDTETVLEYVRRDLAVTEPKGLYFPVLLEQALPQTHRPQTSISDERLPLEPFLTSRRAVLERWKTGVQARDLAENAEFLGRQPSFPRAQIQARANGSAPLLQPRSGTPLVEKQIEYLLAFKQVGVRALSFQIDSLTRNENYTGVEEALLQDYRSGVATLNGFPVIHYGVPTLRGMLKTVRSPMQTRHSARDPRLLAEISYAGGMTAFEGGCIGYNLPYYKDYSLEDSIKIWQYVDRLTGLYHERFGIVLDREFFGVLTGTLIPPCLSIIANIIEALFAVMQGVKSISLGYAEQGNRVQDIAAMRTLKHMTSLILARMGYKDIQINTVFHQYMAAFPLDHQRAEELIYQSAVTGTLSEATRIIIKTPTEAYRIPTLLDNLQGLSLAMQGAAAAKTEQLDETSIAQECQLIEREVQAIFDSVIYCNPGNLADGVVTAFRKGLIDIPFAPSIYNKGEVVTVRDRTGAVRFLSPGNLQLAREEREFHRDKVQERLHAEGVLSEKQGYHLVERDVMQIARGQYTRWPLSS